MCCLCHVAFYSLEHKQNLLVRAHNVYCKHILWCKEVFNTSHCSQWNTVNNRRYWTLYVFEDMVQMDIKLTFSGVAFTEANIGMCVSELAVPGSPNSTQRETSSFKTWFIWLILDICFQIIWDEMNHILEVPLFFSIDPRESPRLLGVKMRMSTL